MGLLAAAVAMTTCRGRNCLKLPEIGRPENDGPKQEGLKGPI